LDEAQETGSRAWMLYVNGLATNTESRAELIMASLEGHVYEHALKFMFKTSNRETEYEAILARMGVCNAQGAGYAKAFSNSQLVVSQVRGEYKTLDPAMIATWFKVKDRSSMLKKI